MSEYRKTFHLKTDCVKAILELDDKYTVDYLMRWSKKDLINYYNTLVFRKERKKEKDENSNR